MGLLACALPAFAVILGAGMMFDGPPEVAFVLIGDGGFTVLETILIILRVALLGTEPFIEISLKVVLTLLAVCAAGMIFCGFDMISLGSGREGCLFIGAGCGEVVLTVYLLAARWFDYYEIFHHPYRPQNPPASAVAVPGVTRLI